MSKEDVNPNSAQQRNINLATRFSKIVIAHATPFMCWGTADDARRRFNITEEEMYDNPDLLQRALDLRDADEAGFLDVTYESIKNHRQRVLICLSQTEGGMAEYNQAVDYLPPQLIYPAVCIKPFSYGKPLRLIDTEGDEVSIDEDNYFVNERGQGYQVRDVRNWGDPITNVDRTEEEIARMPRLSYATDESDSFAIPLLEEHYKKLEELALNIELGYYRLID